MKKTLLIIVTILVIVLSVGCSKEIRDIEKYERRADIYITEKYGVDFEVVESYINKSGQHTIVVQNKENLLVNICADIETPYTFSDNYADTLASHQMADIVDLSFLDKEHGRAKLYVKVINTDVENIDTGKDNIESCSLIVGLHSAPGDLIVRNLYDLYKELDTYCYNNTTITVVFAEKSDNFSNCINNYILYQEIELTKELKTIYKTVNIEEKNLNFENFKKLFLP